MNSTTTTSSNNNNEQASNLERNTANDANATTSTSSSNRRSPVWQYFKLIEKNNKKKTLCTVAGCSTEFSYHGGTTPMLNHLKSDHGEVYKTLSKAESTQSTLTCSNFKLQPLTKERSKLISTSLAKFISSDMRPINIVEGKGFKEFVNTLEPR